MKAGSDLLDMNISHIIASKQNANTPAKVAG